MTEEQITFAYIQSLLGVPYKFGGRNRLEGMDCSQGFIELKIVQGKLPNGFDDTAQGLFKRYGPFMTGVPKFGDAAFYGINEKNITHVAFCLNKSLMFEFGGGDAKTLTLEDAIKRGACGRFRPIKYRKDFLGCAPA